MVRLVSAGMFLTKSMLLSWSDWMLSSSRQGRDISGEKSVSLSQPDRARPSRSGNCSRAEMSSSPA